jgi:nitrogen fixation protein NifX
MTLRKLSLVIETERGEKPMRVAFATEDMQRVDAHFGWARNLAIYEVSPAGHRFAEVVQFDGNLQEDGAEDKLTPKIDALRDCAIVYVAAIGGSAAAKVVNAKVHPVKVSAPESINDILDKLVNVLKGTPPPWLRKAMLKGQDRKFDFEDGAEDE